MTTTLKWILIILGVLILGGGGWYYYQTQKAATTPTEEITTPTTEEVKPTPAPTKDEIVDWKSYINKKYGFVLTFPETWKGYVVIEGIFGDLPVSEFWLPTKDTMFSPEKPGYASMFGMFVYTHSRWAKVIPDDLGSPFYINKNEQYVFAYKTGQDAPDDLVARVPDIKNIISTFKFIP